MHWLIAHVKQWNCFVVRNPNSLLLTWQPNSPDLNPVEYRVWKVMRERVYRIPVQDVAELRQRLMSSGLASSEV